MEEYNIELASQKLKPKNILVQVIIAVVATYAIGILYGMVYYYVEKIWLLMGAIPGVILGYLFSKVDFNHRSLIAIFCIVCTILSLALGGFFASIGFSIGEFPFSYLLDFGALPWNLFFELSFPEFINGGFFDILFSLGVYGLGVICAFGAAFATNSDKTEEEDNIDYTV